MVLAVSAACLLHGLQGVASLVDYVVALIIPDHVIIHVHLSGVEVDRDSAEADLELLDRQKDVAVFVIVSLRDLLLELVGPQVAISAEGTPVAVLAPRVAELEKLLAIFESLVSSYCVSVAQDDAPGISISVASAVRTSSDGVAFVQVMSHGGPDFFDSHVLDFLRFIGSASDQANAIIALTTCDMHVVSTHLGDSLFKDHGPERVVC